MGRVVQRTWRYINLILRTGLWEEQFREPGDILIESCAQDYGKIREPGDILIESCVQDYGKSSLENLEKREKDLLEKEKRQQAELIR